MKLLVLFAAFCLFFPAIASAAEKGPTDFDREEFYEKEKIKAEKGGWKYSQKNADKLFDKMDADGDGILTGQERKMYWDDWAAQKNAKAKGPTDFDREEFYAMEKKKAKKNGWRFNQANADALFDKMDTDNDGIVTGKERKVYWDNWKKSQG
ncbi:MAG: hypothetical protein AB3N64_06640 [Puniceicoccaceae bacterium]